ncbi:MAG: RsmE family RNA methyltransferase [Candidatus Zipacnadales bacterium]
MRRVFIPKEALKADRVTLKGPQAHYLRSVLRLKRGSRFAAVLPTGEEREATLLEVSEDTVDAGLGPRIERQADPATDIRIRPALIKARKLDLIIRACTELGVSEISPVLCERSVPRLEPRDVSHKLERWTKIALEAARQCGRAQPPRVRAPIPFGNALEEISHLSGKSLILIPPTNQFALCASTVLTPEAEPVTLLIGPEGGFSGAEIDEALRSGVQPISLGRRILRAETAAIIACAFIMRELGEL